MTAVNETTWLKRMAYADQRDLTVWRATRHGVSPTFNHSTKPSLCFLSLSQSPAKALLSGWTVWRFEDCLNQTVGLLLTVTTKQVGQEKLRSNFKKTLQKYKMYFLAHMQTNLDCWVISSTNILIVWSLNMFPFLNGAAMNSRWEVTHLTSEKILQYMSALYTCHTRKLKYYRFANTQTRLNYTSLTLIKKQILHLSVCVHVWSWGKRSACE